MEQTPGTGALFRHMEKALDAHRKGWLSRKRLLTFLKWEMAVAEDCTVRTFLTEVQENRNLDTELVDEVTRTYTENVQYWDFPEEPGLSGALPEAIVCTFPELIQSVHGAAGGLRRVRNMLVGVNVRLNLRGSHGALGEALRLVMDELEFMERACEHVGAGTPLAPGITDQKQGAWDSRDGAPLSPKQIVWLADLGQEDRTSALKYADGISWHSTPPQLVTERIRARELQLVRAKENRALVEQMRKAMVQACPRCNSAPGAVCRSRAGRETTMHKGRYTMAS